MKSFQYLTILMAAIVAIEAQMIETLTKFRTWEWMTLRSGYCNNYPACSSIEPIVRRLFPNQQLNRYGSYGECYDAHEGYTYKYNGGCATSTEWYPRWISQNKDSAEACYWLCKTTSNCKYFEYDSSGSMCHLHPSGITKGNGYHNVKCYKMINAEYDVRVEYKTHAEAIKVCKDLGKQLFEPRDSSKNSEVFSLAKTKGVSRFWIGIHDITNEGKFTYDSNGQTIGYKNWNWNEPNDYGSGEDCAEISGWSGTWNDMPCQSLQRFVCENKQPDVLGFDLCNTDGKKGLTKNEVDNCQGICEVEKQAIKQDLLTFDINPIDGSVTYDELMETFDGKIHDMFKGVGDDTLMETSEKTVHDMFARAECNVKGNYGGNDIDYVWNINDATSCQKKCQELLACKFWTYNSQTRNCWRQTKYAPDNLGSCGNDCTRGPRYCPR